MGLLAAADRRALTNLLLQLPSIEDPQVRLALLADLPLTVIGHIPFSSIPATHLTLIIKTLDGATDRPNGRLSDGSWPILSFLEQALAAAAGREIEPPLRALYRSASARALIPGVSALPPAAVAAPPLAPRRPASAGGRDPLTLTVALRQQEGAVSVELSLIRPSDGITTDLARATAVVDRAALLVSTGPEQYGRLLAEMLFAAPGARTGWARARAYADGAGEKLHVRLSMRLEDRELVALHWETLREPESDVPIALDERAWLARTVENVSLRPVLSIPRADLRATVVVAAPDNLAAFGLHSLDPRSEVERARVAFGQQIGAVVARVEAKMQPATLASLRAALRRSPHILYLLCHSRIVDDKVYLCLEDDAGMAAWTHIDALVGAVDALAEQPLLTILGSCFSAGAAEDYSIDALGPRLAKAGIPAVLGFRGTVAPSAVARMLPPLVEELWKDGRIDRALTVARSVLHHDDWWRPVLWLGTASGQLWNDP